MVAPAEHASLDLRIGHRESVGRMEKVAAFLSVLTAFAGTTTRTFNRPFTSSAVPSNPMALSVAKEEEEVGELLLSLVGCVATASNRAVERQIARKQATFRPESIFSTEPLSPS